MKINVDAQQKYKNKGKNGIHRCRVRRWNMKPHWLVFEKKIRNRLLTYRMLYISVHDDVDNDDDDFALRYLIKVRK